MTGRHLLCYLLLVLCCHGCDPAPPAASPPPLTVPKQTVTPEKSPTSAAVAKSGDLAEKKTSPEGLKPQQGEQSRELGVAAAADLRFVLPALNKEFEASHSGVVIKPTFGASGTLFAQISNQAPFDLFLSADVQYAQKLVDNESAVSDSLFRYAVGHIVLWVRKESPLQVQDVGIKAVTDPSVKKVAIANPATAPYGRAAEAALKTLQVYDAIRDKLVLGENVAQTAQFAETGAADVAVIGLSFASAPEFAGKGRFWKFPNDSFPRIEQAGVILKHSKHQDLAREYSAFLKSEAAHAIFQKYGFEQPEGK